MTARSTERSFGRYYRPTKKLHKWKLRNKQSVKMKHRNSVLGIKKTNASQKPLSR